MADGSTKNIQDVNLGDVVKGQTGNNTVLGFHQPKLGDKKLYSYNGGAYFVTAEHPFMTTDGWKAFDPELAVLEHNLDIEIGQLAIGDTLITENGNVVLKTVATKSADAETQLYNFILSGDRTYYADGYLVHNKTACLVSLPNQGCGSNSTCYGTDGYANPNGTSCSLSCTTPGEILTNRCPVGTETTKTETYCGTDYQQHCRVPFVNTCTSSSCTGTYNTTTYVAPWTSTRIGINNCNEVSEDGGSAAVNCPLRSTYCHLNDTYKCNGTLSTVSNSCSTLTQLQCGTKTGCTWGPAPYIPD